MTEMDIAESAIRDLMDALLAAFPGLQHVDPERSIDADVASTGVPERCVKAYRLGLRALGADNSRSDAPIDPP